MKNFNFSKRSLEKFILRTFSEREKFGFYYQSFNSIFLEKMNLNYIIPACSDWYKSYFINKSKPKKVKKNSLKYFQRLNKKSKIPLLNSKNDQIIKLFLEEYWKRQLWKYRILSLCNRILYALGWINKIWFVYAIGLLKSFAFRATHKGPLEIFLGYSTYVVPDFNKYYVDISIAICLICFFALIVVRHIKYYPLFVLFLIDYKPRIKTDNLIHLISYYDKKIIQKLVKFTRKYPAI
ncbi:hypothetical protein [Mycoplasma seminis]|uniref:Uncharacterized protein n=1 Tax=Mycoplasma seminis TaxID=512749 RepID=A0ABY9H9V1_9MOLU|nr:hypothetical protein [Mycoplasma seminis]WLP85374.1 hypothetical protein Q8852_03575 [Mycoplasma seminis]